MCWYQFADPRLAQAYNLIAFDVRFHGETESLRTGEVDTEVCESMEVCSFRSFKSFDGESSLLALGLDSGTGGGCLGRDRRSAAHQVRARRRGVPWFERVHLDRH